MEFLDPKLDEYVVANTTPESQVLRDLNRETNVKVLHPRMLSGHLQGRVLSMLSQMIQPKRVLEIGTYTGYSTICFAEGLAPDGHVHTIDINEELEPMVRRYFAQAGITDKVTLHIGNAVELIPALEEQWDLVFIDADKENYPNYFDAVIERVRPGGFIIADNVLWSGKVIDPAEKQDLDTRTLVQYSQKIHNDSRVENVLFPIRDGLMICRKL